MGLLLATLFTASACLPHSVAGFNGPIPRALENRVLENFSINASSSQEEWSEVFDVQWENFDPTLKLALDPSDPINHVDPLGLAGEGFLYSWLAKKMEEGAQNTSSPALAATASLASEALHMGAGYDPQYTSYQTNQRVSQEIQEHGVRETMGMELVRARTTVEESVGTSDIVRAVDSEGKYSAGERVWYGVQGASKTFLTVMGGMSLAGKSTPAVAAGEKPPPLPSPAAVEMAPEASAAAKTAGQLGREGEAAIEAATGLSKNTESFVVNGRTRIPDFVTARDSAGLPTGLIESKNVQYQSLTRQLQDYRDLVGAGGRVDVALPPGARVSGPLQRAFDNPNNPLFRMNLPP